MISSIKAGLIAVPLALTTAAHTANAQAWWVTGERVSTITLGGETLTETWSDDPEYADFQPASYSMAGDGAAGSTENDLYFTDWEMMIDQRAEATRANSAAAAPSSNALGEYILRFDTDTEIDFFGNITSYSDSSPRGVASVTLASDTHGVVAHWDTESIGGVWIDHVITAQPGLYTLTIESDAPAPTSGTSLSWVDINIRFEGVGDPRFTRNSSVREIIAYNAQGPASYVFTDDDRVNEVVNRTEIGSSGIAWIQSGFGPNWFTFDISARGLQSNPSNGIEDPTTGAAGQMALSFTLDEPQRMTLYGDMNNPDDVLLHSYANDLPTRYGQAEIVVENDDSGQVFRYVTNNAFRDFDGHWYDLPVGDYSVSVSVEAVTPPFSVASFEYAFLDLTAVFTEPSCVPDINSDDVLDLADIQAFVTGFLDQDPATDLNHDDVFDLADVQAFVTSFNAGCP